MCSGSSHAIFTRFTQLSEKRATIYGIVVVAIVGTISLSLTLQGWKSRVPAFDLLTHIYNAQGFIESGIIPKHGDTGSYGSYKTAGTAWLMMPSMALLGDPRLAEYVGAGLLHIATLLGISLLTRRCFGFWTACVAVLVYGLSTQAIWLAGSLWPNGRPDFYVWIVLFTMLWVMRQHARYLAAALTVWGIGMQVDMAMAPAFFILPFVWFYYRPPVRLAPLLIGALIVLTVWSPYLWFESVRGFADIKSQLLLQNIFPANYLETWCDPELPLYEWQDPVVTNGHPGSAFQTSATGALTTLQDLWLRVQAVNAKVISNFSLTVSFPGANIGLLLMVLSSICLCCVGASIPRKKVSWSLLPNVWLKIAFFALLLVGVAVSALTLGYSKMPVAGAVIGRIPRLLLLGMLVLLAGPRVVAASGRILSRLRVELPQSGKTEIQGLLVLCLLVPWFILIILAEPGKPERLWWLWPVQVIFLSAFVTYFMRRFTPSRAILATAQLVVTLVIGANPFLLSRTNAWMRDGWAGHDAPEIQVVDAIARELKADGKGQAAIGYHVFIYPFMANYNITNPIYKAGAEFDLLFRYRHEVANTNQCPEGLSPVDEYRIVQTKPKLGEEPPEHHFEVSLESGFRQIKSFGLYQVFKRD